ncbi:hypothetical protein Daura_06685 [Dactylosporangium aurantiacum]|uniref:ATP synthase protein I n=1 Tax=Dactylosporangium aurantiacum TaxID=35754 RepID=A0A9Q9IMT5_9ACTN|nr:hypothetical protein [Dactylosporangium aurantiacum]MDG6106081.1 hypothetical protein [Dactylosporangium aurantiacum]UWZ55875.1 hypothetical protein Daura_06685 [Dactylosporangium aurantiacum]
MKKRLQHLRTALLAMGILLVVAAPLAGWRDGATGALGALAGVGLVAVSYTLSSLVIAVTDLRARHLLMPVALGTYILKFAVIGVVMWLVAGTEWAGLPWLGALVIAGTLVWVAAQAVWVWRAKIPYVEIEPS